MFPKQQRHIASGDAYDSHVVASACRYLIKYANKCSSMHQPLQFMTMCDTLRDWLEYDDFASYYISAKHRHWRWSY